MDVLNPSATAVDAQPTRRRRLSLGARLAATTTLPLLAAFGALFLNLTVRERKNTIASKTVAAQMVANVVATGLSAPLDFGDREDLRVGLDVLKTNDDVTGASLWDRDPVELLVEWHRAGTAPVGQGQGTVAADRIEVALPVHAHSRAVPSQLIVRFSLARENSAYAQSRQWLFAVLFILASVTVVLLNAMMRFQIVNPLRRLARAAGDLERGAIPLQVDASSGDEIGTLAGAFNRMGKAVASRHVRLETAVQDERLEGAMRFRRLIEAMPDAIVLCRAGRITYANPSFIELARAGTADLVGRDLASEISGHEAVQEGLPHALVSREERWQFDERSVVVDTRTLAVEIDGHTSTMLIARDVTEHRRVAAQLVQADTELRQAQKLEAIGRLAGGVAHDFNNMLSVILGYAVMLLDGMASTDPLYGPLFEIKLAGERSADLTHQLLAFSRQQQLETRIVNLNDVIESTTRMVRRVVGEDIQIRTVLVPEVCNAEVEPGQIEQVIMNLVVNARDAMPGGGQMTIETSVVASSGEDNHHSVPPGDYVVLAVSDNGTGMDTETQERIFEPFFTTKEEGKGTGLGLSTVFGIVNQCGGHISVHSEPGAGTSFKLYFPRRGDAGATPALVSAPPAAASSGETVLVVEDEEPVRRLVHEVLRRRGYHVLVARHPGEALMVCEQYKGNIDLLLTDVMMPQMNGRELAERLGADRPHMKILYMSGYIDHAALPRGAFGSAASFLQKPITPDLLSRKVRGMLDSTSPLGGG